MIDFLTVMLLGLVSGLFVLAFFVFQLKDLEQKGLKQYIPAFLVIGFIMTATGLYMSFTWPLPGSYNIAYGEMSLAVGVLFLGSTVNLAKGWSFLPLTIFAFFSGAAAILIGSRIVNLNLTKEPAMAGAGFILVGLFAVLSPGVYLLRRIRALSYVAMVILVVAGVVWMMTAFGAYWDHLENFADWAPMTMK